MTTLDLAVRAEVYDGAIRRREIPSIATFARALQKPEPDIRVALANLADAHMVVLQPESGEVLVGRHRLQLKDHAFLPVGRARREVVQGLAVRTRRGLAVGAMLGTRANLVRCGSPRSKMAQIHTRGSANTIYEPRTNRSFLAASVTAQCGRVRVWWPARSSNATKRPLTTSRNFGIARYNRRNGDSVF